MLEPDGYAEAGESLQASPGQGEYSSIAGIDNSGKSLPGGFSNKPLSASQLAAIQAKDAKVQQTASNAATVASPAGATSDGASQQVRLSCSGYSLMPYPRGAKRSVTYGLRLAALHSTCPATSADMSAPCQVEPPLLCSPSTAAGSTTHFLRCAERMGTTDRAARCCLTL